MTNYLDSDHWKVSGLIDELSASASEARALQVISFLKPTLKQDGNKWCYILGEMPVNYVAGFGNTPAEAMHDFNKNFFNGKITAPEGDKIN